MEKLDCLVGSWISMLYRCGQIYIGRKLKEYNLGSGQYPFLLKLYENDGISQEELSEQLKIDKATTAKAIKRLAKEGFVVRKIDERDKRAYRIYLTAKANDQRVAMHEIAFGWVKLLYSGMSQQEKEQAARLLATMAKNTACILRKEDIMTDI